MRRFARQVKLTKHALLSFQEILWQCPEYPRAHMTISLLLRIAISRRWIWVLFFAFQLSLSLSRLPLL